jgi:hypothetical protein
MRLTYYLPGLTKSTWDWLIIYLVWPKVHEIDLLFTWFDQKYMRLTYYLPGLTKSTWDWLIIYLVWPKVHEIDLLFTWFDHPYHLMQRSTWYMTFPKASTDSKHVICVWRIKQMNTWLRNQIVPNIRYIFPV